MKQMNVYHYLGIESDPIFNIISRLKAGQVVELGDMKIQLNSNGLYELESELRHECFRNEQEIYDGLAKLI